MQHQIQSKNRAEQFTITATLLLKKQFLLFMLFLLTLFNVKAQTTYTWNGGATGAWGTATNWTPTRTTPATTDIIQFNSGTIVTITGVPAQTIGQLILSNSTSVALQSSILTLTIAGGSGTDLEVQSGSSLVIGGTTTATRLTLAFAASTSADVEGSVTVGFGGDTGYSSTNTLNIGTCDFTVKNGGSLNNDGVVTWPSGAYKVTLEAGSIYNLMRNGGGFPPATTISDPASTIKITGTKTTAPNTPALAIGNLIIDCPNLTSNISWSLGTVTIQGDLTVVSTGASATFTLGTATNVTVNGDYIQSGGKLNIVSSSNSGSLTINGDLYQSGGTLSNGGSGTATLTLKGSLNQTAGTISNASSGTTNLAFTGASTQAVNLAGLVTNKVNYSLNNIGGIILTGTMPVNTGATLTITNTGTLITGTGTVTYSGTATLKYNASIGSQTTSAIEFPATNGPANLIIDNGNGVTLSGDGTVSGTLTLTTGLLRLNNHNLTVGSISVTSPSVAKMIVPGTGQLKKTFAAGASSFTFPIGEEAGTTEYLPVTLAFTANSMQRTIGVSMTKGKHSSMDVGGVQTDYLNRYWSFTNDQAGTYSYTGSFTYAPGDVNGNPNNLKINSWNGTSWSQASSSSAPNVLTILSALTETTGTLGGNDFTGRVIPVLFFN